MMLASQYGGNFLVRFKRFQGIEPLAPLEDLKFELSHPGCRICSTAPVVGLPVVSRRV